MTDTERLGLGSPRTIGEDVAEAFMVQQAGALALERLVEMGLIRPVFPPAPAAGSELTVTVPAGVYWEILSVTYRLTTSAVVANRQSTIQVSDSDGNAIWNVASSRAHAAATNLRYTWSCGYGMEVASATITESLPSPPLLIPAGWAFKTVLVNGDVGDAYTQIVLMVREWSLPRLAQRLRYLMADLDAAGGLV